MSLGLFFRNFLILTFRKKTSYILHFLVPILVFLGMYLLLKAAESEAFAASQAIGLVVFYTMIQASMIVSLVLRDKEQGIFKRIRVSPVASVIYLAGNGTAALLVLTVQVLVFAGFISFIFPVPLGLGFFQVLFILFIFSITSVGFGFFICSLSETSSGALVLANIIVMFTGFMGGSFFPVEFMGPFIRKLAYAFPQFWVMRAIRLSQASAPAAETGWSLLVLLLFGALFIILWGVINRSKRGVS